MINHVFIPFNSIPRRKLLNVQQMMLTRIPRGFLFLFLSTGAHSFNIYLFLGFLVGPLRFYSNYLKNIHEYFAMP